MEVVTVEEEFRFDVGSHVGHRQLIQHIYALQDEVFDKENKLHSIPAMLGKTKALNVSRLLHIICATLIFCTGFFFHFLLFYIICQVFLK